MDRTFELSSSLTSIRQGLSFRARSVIISNWSAQSVYISAASRICPPWTIGYVVTIPPSIIAEAKFAPAEGLVLQPAVTGTLARVTWIDTPIDESMGISIAPASQQGTLSTVTVTPTTVNLPVGATGFVVYGLGGTDYTVFGVQSNHFYCANTAQTALSAFVNLQDLQVQVSFTGGGSIILIPYTSQAVVFAQILGLAGTIISANDPTDRTRRELGRTSKRAYDGVATSAPGAGTIATITLAGNSTQRWLIDYLDVMLEGLTAGGTADLTSTNFGGYAKHFAANQPNVQTRSIVTDWGWRQPVANQSVTITFSQCLANMAEDINVGAYLDL